MSVITKVLKQKCVYWAPDAVDVFGQPTYSVAVELDCRWDDVQQQIIKNDGTMVISKAEVMLSADVAVGGVLMFGLLESIMYLNEPTRNNGAFEILKFDKNPNFKCTEFVRTAYL